MFLKEYSNQCKELVAPLGFRRKGNTFGRVINDVVQTFTLERYGSGHLCRVVFLTAPLCSEFECVPIGLLALKRFEGSYDEDWFYDAKNSESVSSVIKTITEYMEKHLIPFFERSDSTKTAFETIMEVRKLFETRRKAHLRLEGIWDCADPDSWVGYYDRDQYYLALKSGHYDYAIKSITLMLENVREEFLQQYQEELKRLESQDYVWFETIFRENELKSREILKCFSK